MFQPVIIAFDLFGTILSTASIARSLADLYGPETAQKVADIARTLQLEYTWRANSMGVYEPLDDLTRHSFREAVVAAGCSSALSSSQEDVIMRAYDRLDLFPDVRSGLERLVKDGVDAWAFSNGTRSMMQATLSSAAASASPDGDLVGRVFPTRKMVSVDDVGVFKPHPSAYQYMREVVEGVDSHGKALWLVSSNPFDVVGATAAGYWTAWIDRNGKGWVDGLGSAMNMGPTVVVGGMDEAVKAILEYTGY
ncbi:2-haloacid dehalogenase [Geosmithia morbida]|uniref:2-haloacid dehalogenase n=1 Tax=Geosmithia morbida TaxID=1094350 RepID=A0A9P5D6Z4_9HYPO|nr:2-haloacid dehalogenase [Geosmithia morbida]KAF4126076.1 2-haloacid dehalogenase [Geosmithia morbida]